jgi:hypothetical protein
MIRGLFLEQNMSYEEVAATLKAAHDFDIGWVVAQPESRLLPRESRHSLTPGTTGYGS